MFSVITPTFNRANTLERVYYSLTNQTFKNFEWLIIDDASTDNTEELVSQWKNNDKSLNIQYHRLPVNKGKPSALNYAFSYCTMDIIIIADSDDTFKSNTFQELYFLWSSVNNSHNGDKIASIWTLCEDETGGLVGEKFPKNFWQVNFNERILHRKYEIKGEKWHSWRKSVLMEFKMFENENIYLIGESATWDRINKTYDFLCSNLIHRTYWISEDGLILTKKPKIINAKIKYYTSYYKLVDSTFYGIIKYPYLRKQGLSYVKSSFLYKDKELSLNFTKTVACYCATILEILKNGLKR